MTTPPAIRIPRTALAAGAVAIALAAAGSATAAPTISGSDTDVWNASQPEPAYTITASTRGLRIFWRVAGVDAGNGRSPLTVKLEDLQDGSYALQASEGTNDAGFSAAFARTRAFRVDVTPPTITITQPAAGGVFAQGATILADYACAGAVSCAGPVAPGAAIDTGSAGAKGFRVTAKDDAGNEATADAGYSVLAPPASPPVPAPVAATTTVTAPRSVALVTPATVNARMLTPRRGATIATRRPLLRWPRLERARLYNLQVFRLRGSTAVKVLSVFPRVTRYRVPPKRIAFGDRYVWRVWPYLLATGFPKRPLGLSFFDVRSKPAP